MEALSYYSNSSDMNIFTPPTQPELLLPSELVGCMNDNNFTTFPSSCNIIDDYNYLFDTNDDFFYLDNENCNSLLLPNFSSSPIDSISTQPFSLQHELDPFHFPKRQKLDSDFEQLYYTDDQFNFNGFVPNPCLNLQNYSLGDIVVPQLPEFPISPPVYCSGSCDRNTKQQPPKNRGSLSAQSIAARQRRRKITDKTQELGKLIPGGNKLNTAEMFQAAYKYIKFLQAQVGILEFMGSYDHTENGGNFQSEEMHCFLESSVVQEKLYATTEKCVVPTKLVQELSSDHQMIESKPQVSKEIRQLIPM